MFRSFFVLLTKTVLRVSKIYKIASFEFIGDLSKSKCYRQTYMISYIFLRRIGLYFVTLRSLSLSLAKFLTTSDMVSSDWPFPLGIFTIVSFFSGLDFGSFVSEASNRLISLNFVGWGGRWLHTATCGSRAKWSSMSTTILDFGVMTTNVTN